MVHNCKVKRSRVKNRCSAHASYPRDIWHFIAQSQDRVSNTRTGCLLQDVLESQLLNADEQTQVDNELLFPKTIAPTIDTAQLRKKPPPVDPEQLALAEKRARRWKILESTPCSNGNKKIVKGIKDRRVNFNVDKVEQLVAHYKSEQRPAWLQPKQQQRGLISNVDNDKPRDLSAGMSRAAQEEMLDQKVFNEATQNIARAHKLENKFARTQARLKLERVASDLSLNRMFLSPEASKSAGLHNYFTHKTLDPNLTISVIENASPTKFYEMLHRTLPLQSFKPVPYNDIVLSLTPDPEEPPADLARSPYLTFVTPPGSKPYVGPHDHHKWGKMAMQDVFTLSDKHREDSTSPLPRGLGKTARQLKASWRQTAPLPTVKTTGSVFITQADMAN